MKHLPFILRVAGDSLLIGMSIYQQTILGFFGWLSVLAYDIFNELQEAKDKKYYKQMDEYIEHLKSGITQRTTFVKKDENNN